MIIAGDASAGDVTGVNISDVTITGGIAEAVRLYGRLNTVTIANSKIANNAGNGITVLDPSERNLKLVLRNSRVYKNGGYGLQVNAARSQGIDLDQNVFYDNGTINVAVGSDLHATRIKNNIFYADVPMTHLYTSGALSNLELDQNCYSEGVNMIGYNGVAYSTLASFVSATGYERSGSGSPLALANPSAGDFTPTGPSSCRGSKK